MRGRPRRSSPSAGFAAGLALLALCSLVLSAHAVEEANPFRPRLPPVPPYPANQAILVTEPLDGSILFEMPQQITVNFRPFDFGLEPSSLELWVDGQEYTESLRFWIDSATLDANLLPAESRALGVDHTILAKVRDVLGLYHQIFTTFKLILPPCVGGCPWPFSPTDQPNVVSNLMEDWQTFTGTPYFHSGLDIRANAGTAVHACVGGEVVKVIQYKPSALYWEVAVKDSAGFVWQYHHLSGASITVSEGDFVDRGDVLGNVVTWSSSMNGVTYNHLHLNVVSWLGGGAVPGPYVDGFEHYNPLRYLIKGTPDGVVPLQFDVWFTANESNFAFAAGSDPGDPVLSGDVDVVAQLRDRRDIIPPANGQPYELGIYKLSYGATPISTPCGMGLLPKRTLVMFHTMPGGTTVASQDAILKEIYKETLNYGPLATGSLYNYGTQRFFYTLSNSHNGHPDGPNGFWNTDQSNVLGAIYPDGTYQLTVYAQDYYGNETATPIQVSLSNGNPYLGICPVLVDGPVWVHPMDLVTVTGEFASFKPPFFPIAFGAINEGSAHAAVDFQTWPVWSFELPSRGARVMIGLLRGHLANIEYAPLLGDVIFDVDAEVQVAPLGGPAFNPDLPAQNPVRFRMSTRLARDPWSGQARIGRPATLGETDFALALAQPIQALGETFILRNRGTQGSQVDWRLHSTPVAPGPMGEGGVRLAASPNPFQGNTRVQLTADRELALAVDVLDLRGRRIRQLHAGAVTAGRTQFAWDGDDAFGKSQPPGMYWIRVTGSGVRAVHKVARLQ